ncbi:hypothetical protein C0J52_06718 [Blattella germanica]|nr:hypothetical protein C0J52_06718 [Blattella germanica]
MAHTKVNSTPVKEQIEKSIDFILNLNEIELIQTEEISKINEIDSEFDVDSQFTKVQQKNRDFEKEHNAFNICKANDTEHSVYPLGNVSETTYEEDIEILENDIDISDKVSSTDNGNDNSTPENAHKYDTGNIFKTKCNNIEVAYKSEDNIKKSSTIVSHNIDSSVDVGNRNLHNKKSNTNDKLHTCDTCGKTLQTLSGFTRHRRSHLHNKKSNTKYKLHTCDTCGKTFQSLSCLTRHRRSHESRVAIFIVGFVKLNFIICWILLVEDKVGEHWEAKHP